jgi:hypothetical protein
LAKSVTITVHPSALSGESLTVSDALRQVLDTIDALEMVEAETDSGRKIVWRLAEAHTNSPPFTVVAVASPRDSQVSVEIEAGRVAGAYAQALNELMAGRKPDWMAKEVADPLKRVFKRNLNGVGFTEIEVNGLPPTTIAPNTARVAVNVLEQADIAEREDLRRTEYGSIEGEVVGLAKIGGSPAIVVLERLSAIRVPCVLSDDLEEDVGPHHQWSEVWQGKYVRISGALHYDSKGALKRVNATSYQDVVWADIPVSALRGIDILDGRTIREHLDEIWGE